MAVLMDYNMKVGDKESVLPQACVKYKILYVEFELNAYDLQCIDNIIMLHLIVLLYYYIRSWRLFFNRFKKWF